MKNHEIDAPVSVLRRKLMLALPSGLAAASPLALIACGSGSDAESAPAGADPADPEIAALVAKLPAFERTAVPVAVTLPAGSAVTLASTHLVTPNNVSEVAADGTAGAVLLGGAAQMAYLFDAAGRLLLMGIIEPGASTALNSRSSAEALILIASEAALEGDAMEVAVRETLRTHAIVEPVRLAVEAAHARGGIDDTDSPLTSAIETAVRALRGTPAQAARSRDRALGIQINPDTAQSGVGVERSADYNTVLWRNSYRRRTHVWVARTGSYDAAGNFTPLPTPVAVKNFGLNATTALSFDNLVIGVGDYLAELAKDIGFLGAYQQGNSWWNPVTSAPLALAVEPAGAAVSVYRTRVIGIGITDGVGFNGADEEARFDEILGATLWEDICLPLIKTFLLPMISKWASTTYTKEFKTLVGSLLLSATVDLAKIEVSNKYLPTTVAAMRRGDAADMVFQFFKEFFGSGVWKTLLEKAMQAMQRASSGDLGGLAYSIRDKSGNLIGVNLLKNENHAIADKLSAALSKVARIITVIKVATTAGDFAALAKDWSASSRADEFKLNVSAAKISLSPSPVVVSYLAGTAGKGAVTAKVEGLDGGVTPENVFLEWACPGRYGNLFKRGGTAGSDVNTFESVLANPTHDYFPSQLSDDPATPDTIKVTAFYRNVTTNQRVEMGSVTVPVQFKKEFNLSITPASGTDVPTDTELAVTAVIKEPLPDGTTVSWVWTHGGVGALSEIAADANPRDSSVNFKSASTEGSATLTVQATLTLPAGATTPPRIVVTDPVSTQLNVKKGLKTITLEGYWVLEAGSIPLDPLPPCFIDGAGKPACSLGNIDTWAVYVLPKVANAAKYAFNIHRPGGGLLASVTLPHPNVVDGGNVWRWRYWGLNSTYSSYDGVSNYAKTQADAITYVTSRATNEGPRVFAVVTLKP